MNEVHVVGIHLGKNVFHLICMNEAGVVVKRRRRTRPQLFAFFRNGDHCLVGREACASAHFIARRLTEMGHDARLMPAQYVKPYVGQQKNDFADAEAIAEAVQRPRMRFVPIKSRDQLELQAIHRVHDRLVARRTAVSNQIRGLLVEHGIVMRKGRGGFRGFVPTLLGDENSPLSPAMRHLIGGLWEEWCAIDTAVQDLTRQLEQLAKQDEACCRLITVPGLVRWSPPPWLPRYPTDLPSREGETLPPGSALCPSRCHPEARHATGELPSAGTPVYDACSSTAPAAS